MSMFHTSIKCGDKFFKLVIDGGSSFNVVSESVFPRSKLKLETRPWPYMVAWMNKLSLLFLRVAIHLGRY